MSILDFPRSSTSHSRPLLFRGGNRTEVLRLVADLCSRLATWIERDHCAASAEPRERARMVDVARLLRSTAAAAQERDFQT